MPRPVLLPPPAGETPCRTLRYCDPPIAYESLMGFLTRNIAKHGIDRVTPVLKVVGIDTLVPESLPISHIGKTSELAALLGTSREEMAARMHPIQQLDSRPKDAFISFFGAPMLANYREKKQRRVAPMSLAASEFHRAVWDVRVFDFCPESKERLISACPICTRPLGWRTTFGIAYCEHCLADLREHPQPKIVCSDMQALDYLCDLISPDTVRKARAEAMTPTTFTGLTNGEMFEFAVTIGWAITSEFRTTKPSLKRAQKRDFSIAGATTGKSETPPPTVKRDWSVADFGRLTPNALARAARVVLDWPNAFHALADGTRASASERAGHWGSWKELDTLLFLPRDKYLAPAIKAMLSSEIDANMARAKVPLRRRELRNDDYISLTNSFAECGIGSRILRPLVRSGALESVRSPSARRSIIRLKRSEVEKIAVERNDATSAAAARKRLGIDHVGLDALAEAKLIRPIQGLTALTLCGLHFSNLSIDEFVGKISAALTSASYGKIGVSLFHAAARADVAIVPWPTIFSAIIKGRLAAVMYASSTNVSLTRSIILINKAAFTKLLHNAPDLPMGLFAERSRLNTFEAAAILRTNEGFMCGLVRTGLLRTNGAKEFKLDRAVVLKFRESFVLTNEIANRLGCCLRDVKKIMAINGAKPTQVLGGNRQLIWNRDEVEAAVNRAMSLSQHRTSPVR